MASERVVEGKGLYAWLDRRFLSHTFVEKSSCGILRPKILIFGISSAALQLSFWYCKS